MGGHRQQVANKLDKTRGAYVGQHVESSDGPESQRPGDLQRPDGVLGLAERVVGVAVADVAPDRAVQGRDDAVSAAGGALEGVAEVVWLVDLEGAAQRRKAGEDDEQDDEQLDDAQQVLQPQPPLQREAVDEEGRRDAGQADAALVPAVDLDLRGVEDIFAKDDGVRAGPSCRQSVSQSVSQHNRCHHQLTDR